MLRFATNDDTTMLAIAAGGYGGRPSPYVVNIHFIIGYILKTLYTVIPDVNWFTVLYFVMYFLASAYVICIIARVCESRAYALITGHIMAGLSFFLLMSFFSFTVVAYALLTAGLTGLIYADSRQPVPVRPIIISTVYIISAALMRTDVINTAIVMVTVYGIVSSVLLKDKKPLLRMSYVLIGLIVTEYIAIGSNTLCLMSNAVEAAFYNWGELRSKALDCAPVPYDEALFSQNGFSRASYDACYGAFYYIKDAVSADKMKMLTDWNVNRYDPHIIGYIRSHFGAYLTDGYRRIWQEMLAFITTAGVIAGSKVNRRKNLALYIAVISADYVYHFIRRPMLHVMMPTYVMGGILGTVLLAGSMAQLSGDKKRNKTVVEVITVLTVILTAGAAYGMIRDPIRYSMTLTGEQAKSLREGREYMRKHPDELFFALDPTVFAVSTDEDMWHNRYETEPYNLAGNWEIYSLPSNVMLESYGIDSKDPGRELPDNDKAIFLQSSEDMSDPNKGYVIDLYREYYDMDVHFEQISRLENGWKAYRLINNAK